MGDHSPRWSRSGLSRRLQPNACLLNVGLNIDERVYMNTDLTNLAQTVSDTTITPTSETPSHLSALPPRTNENRSLAVLPRPRVNKLPRGHQRLVDAISTFRSWIANLGFGASQSQDTGRNSPLSPLQDGQ